MSPPLSPPTPPPLDAAHVRPVIAGLLLTPRERPIFQSYSSVMFMTASILGPLAGGFLTDYLHWSFIFWIMLPLGVVALAMTDRALKLIPRNDRPHRLDVIGAAVMVVAA